MTIKRRELMIAGASTLALGSIGLASYRILGALEESVDAGALPAGTPPVASAPPLAKLVEWLRHELSYLTFASDVFARFEHDLGTVAHPEIPLVMNAIQWPQLLLLSTDFFQNGGDEKRTIGYVMLFHPYASPCYDPFRRA